MSLRFSLPGLAKRAKIFKIRGGVHPADRKELTADRPIETLPTPSILRVPLQQHIGAAAEPIVQKGDRVLKGQLLASGRGAVSAAIHAPTSGTVIAIGRFVSPHPSGLPVATITLRSDGEERWIALPPALDFETAEAEAIAKRVAESGIVGMGGATFPSAVKLNLGKRYALQTLVINAAECEPYLTCDDRLMRERGAAVADGIAWMARALGVKRVLIAIEANKPDASAAMRKAITSAPLPTDVVTVPTQYPMGSEKHLVQTLTGRETPARALTADIGVVVHNAATAYAVHRACTAGEPLIRRIVTVSGKGIVRPANIEAPIGAAISDLLGFCDGMEGEMDRLLLGGPMMGQPMTSARAPIVKGSNGVLALTKAETPREKSAPCIRCGTCVSVCPCGLTPLEMYGRIKADTLDEAVAIGLMDCVGCGSCSYVCPSNIPLIQAFSYAKGALTAQARAKHKAEEAKRLTAARDERMAKIAQAKKEAMARRKAERAAKQKAEADAKAESPEAA